LVCVLKVAGLLHTVMVTQLQHRWSQVYVQQRLFRAHRVIIKWVKEHQLQHATDPYGLSHHWYGIHVHQRHVSMYVIAQVDITVPVCIVSKILDVMIHAQVIHAVNFILLITIWEEVVQNAVG
jgi:hypothetical protein